MHSAFGTGSSTTPETARFRPNSALTELKKFDEFDDGNAIRAFFGDRGFFVFDEKVSLIDGLYHYMEKAAEQSCGACTPCRMGTVLVRDALDKMRRGLDSPLDFDDIETARRADED